MSELNVYHHELRPNEYAEFYLKYEADKMIADLEESHKMEVEQLLMEIAELKADYKEACGRLQTANLIKDDQLAATRHSKYKRCAAMTMWCKSKSEIYNEFAADASEYMPSYEARFRSKAVLYQKWATRWLELAEQFKDKEAK